MFRPAHCSLYRLYSQEKKRKKNSSVFFLLFTATWSPEQCLWKCYILGPIDSAVQILEICCTETPGYAGGLLQPYQKNENVGTTSLSIVGTLIKSWVTFKLWYSGQPSEEQGQMNCSGIPVKTGMIHAGCGEDSKLQNVSTIILFPFFFK